MKKRRFELEDWIGLALFLCAAGLITYVFGWVLGD